MPIIVKDFSWKQSEDTITIRIPLKGVHHSKVDVTTASTYIKLHYNPFICEIFLAHCINCHESKCTFSDSDAILELMKRKPISWKQLESNLNKDEKSSLRFRIIEEIQTQQQESINEKNKMKDNCHKYAVSEAIQLDTHKREIIEKSRRESLNSTVQKFNTTKKPPAIADKAITKQIPPPRKTGVISFSFTKRLFTTPSRESTEQSEKEYLKKINDARRATGFISEDLRPEEQDPEWCKRKGDEFLQAQNYLGAISAYSHGIKLSNKLPSLYSNRAVAHYLIGNFESCVRDCSSALDLLQPICEANLESRIKCIVRRAAGLTRLGMLNKAINEMKIAVKLQPSNEKLKQDLYQMERAWEQDPDSD